MTDQREMRFEGGRELKDSLQHYFPHTRKSFILFELYNPSKQNYYCILVKREKNNELAYHYIRSAYQADWFSKALKAGQQEVITSEEFFEKLGHARIETINLRNNKERYQQIYLGTEQASPVVRLTQVAKDKSSSHTNHFTKIYKYLLRSTSISSDDLVNALLLAFNPSPTTLSAFSDRQSDDLETLEKLDKRIQTLQTVQDKFLTLKEDYQTYKMHLHTQGKAYYTFFQCYPKVIEELKKVRTELDQEHTRVQEVLNQQEKEISRIDRNIGGTEHSIATQEKEVQSRLETLNQIEPYNTPLARAQLQEEITALEQQAQSFIQLQKQAPNPVALAEHIGGLTHRVSQLKVQIQHFDQLLAHHLSPDRQISKKLNSLLSPALLMIHKKHLKKPITKMSEEMNLFDGLIDITQVDSSKPFITLEELQEQLHSTERDLKVAEQLQADAQVYRKVQKDLQEKRQRFNQLEALPQLKAQLKQAQAQLKQLQKRLYQLNSRLQAQQTERSVHQSKHIKITEDLTKNKNESVKYNGWVEQLHKQSNVGSVEELLPIEALPAIYEQIKKLQDTLQTSKGKWEQKFNDIKKSMDRHDSDVAAFIAEIDGEIASLESTIESRDKLLEGVINKFVQPTATFLRGYREFKKDLEKFSHTLSKAQISGIHKFAMHLNEQTQLLTDLQQISQITTEGMLDLTNNRQASLKTLRKYIREKRDIALQQLFTLQIRINLQPHSRPTDLDPRKQMQSRGTDKMIRLFIFLHLLKRLLELDPEKPNHIAIYVDEIGTLSNENIQKLIDCCRSCQVVPIFAGTGFTDGLQKYYPLVRYPENQNKVWVDETHLIEGESITSQPTQTAQKAHTATSPT